MDSFNMNIFLPLKPVVTKKDQNYNNGKYRGGKFLLREGGISLPNDHGIIQNFTGRKPRLPYPENVNSIRTRNKSQAGIHHRHSQNFLLPL